MIGPRQPTKSLTESLDEARFAALGVMDKPFMTKFLAGAVEFDYVHEEISRWHKSPDGDALIELPEWLGLLPAEFMILVENEAKFQRYLEILRDETS